ncbi:MAG TPA: response regulator [Thermoanaerobaculia bacterium]|jgi:DNA-binding SARP family transcriptional activator|nr:response regulator [Thermoanaerobaculia bacterium]
MQLLTIRLLGEFSAVDHRGNSLSIGSARLKALVVYLALRLERGGSATELAELIFGNRNNAIHVADLVGELRYALRYIPAEIVLVAAESLRFNPEVVAVDARLFEALAARPAINSTREAAELYSGNLLEGYTSGIAAFDEWLGEERLHYWRAAVGVFGRLLAAQIKAGWWERAVETAGKLLSLDPSQEVVHRTLMRLQLEQGRPDAALRRYQECADILQRQFGRAPSAETERVHEEIVAALNRAPAPREVFRNPLDGPTLILLVEDDLVSSALVEGFLHEAGYEVVAVADGADALIEIGRREFDLLILDINIPTLDGLRLFEIMIQKGINTPAIFITGVAGAEAEARSLEMGAADFLRKPLRKEILLPRIRTILQHRQRTEPAKRQKTD